MVVWRSDYKCITTPLFITMFMPEIMPAVSYHYFVGQPGPHQFWGTHEKDFTGG